MSNTHDSDPPLNTFVVRFWREQAQGNDRWHGHVLHIQSGESATFANEDALMSFIGRWVQWVQEKDDAIIDTPRRLHPEGPTECV